MTTTEESTFVAIQSASEVLDDIRRARELYRYLQPNNLLHPNLRRRGSTFGIDNEHVPSLSAALAPYCQLAVLRCNVRKAMLNVMDRDTMYFLAESCRTKTDPVDGKDGTYEFVEDPILMSCSAVPLKGRICELTIRQDPPETPSQSLLFVIPDLLESQFANMSIVSGPPYYRFYAGVPMTTREGVNIGSLAVMDDRPRAHGLTREEEDFLTHTAQQIIVYLETNRQAIEGRRSRRMAEGLEAFIAGKKCLGEDLANRPSKVQPHAQSYGLRVSPDSSSDDESDSPQKILSDLRRQTRLKRKMGSRSGSDSDVSASEGSTEVNPPKEQDSPDEESRSHAPTFGRAANLLRECMGDLGEEGSVRFLSLKSMLGTDPGRSKAALSNSGKNGTSDDDYRATQSFDASAQVSTAEVIACSTAAQPFSASNDAITGCAELDDVALRDLMKRYPGGHLWSLEGASHLSSDEDSRNNPKRVTSAGRIHKSSSRRRYEFKIIRAAFPTARQVLFAPLWDAIGGVFAHGVFVTTALETRSFSASSELSFLNSFCSTVMGECSRLDTMMADKQKSDFVGTISHEMRSPLHGVLASAEFLAETDLTSFQRSLIDTIDSCGRTLLDTINHVLDFSKVNSFQKQWQASNSKFSRHPKKGNFLGPDNMSRTIAHGAPALLQLLGVTDISAVLEEVIDGLVLGNTYDSGIDITDTSREARGRGVAKPGMAKPSLPKDPVEIILDIEQADWAFMTQPGAVRRIIMNITGNAIKYTQQGTIHVCLRLLSTADSSDDSSSMVLTVTDTGKGISPEFLSSRLFVPFAQENALAPGTGLGLSIVQSIVLMLGGTIDVRSTVGRGTTVEVSLPLKRPLPGQVSTQTTPHSNGTSGSGSSTHDELIMLLRNQASESTVAYFQGGMEASDIKSNIVQHYVHDWYHLDFIGPQSTKGASIIIVEEEDVEDLIQNTIGTTEPCPALVVLCSVLSRHNPLVVQALEQRVSGHVEFLAKPFGPYKLARSIGLALEKKRSINPRFPQVTNLGVIPEAVTPLPTASTPLGGTRGSTVDHLAEMDLNSPGSDDACRVIQANETFAVSQKSYHGQIAVAASGPSISSPTVQKAEGDDFPFPVQPTEPAGQPGHQQIPVIEDPKTSTGLRNSLTEKTPVAVPQRQESSLTSQRANPRVLIVDDNKINLKLLDTFLGKKRQYTQVARAEDGQQAVNAVESADEHFDMIFMDISMPIMNGFEATRAIREYEARRQIRPGAMVIALTGLASGKDQSEGFDSGCDIYMTKPVSFKEVGKLLDKWEEHQTSSLAEEMERLDSTLGAGSNPLAVLSEAVTSGGV